MTSVSDINKMLYFIR